MRQLRSSFRVADCACTHYYTCGPCLADAAARNKADKAHYRRDRAGLAPWGPGIPGGLRKVFKEAR